MGNKSKIEWVNGGSTWNPIIARRKSDGKRGWFCTKVSTGCKNCYAEAMNLRLGTGGYYTPISRHGIDISIHEKTMQAPLRWTRPRMIFVCSMTDLFHENVYDDDIAAVFGVMASCERHTFQVLTKRPERMEQLIMSSDFEDMVIGKTWTPGFKNSEDIWPLKNVWLGTSIEHQNAADMRLQHLMRTPAYIRFISAEPLLEVVRLRLPSLWEADKVKLAELGTWPYAQHIDWVICGGESGVGARPMSSEAARQLRDDVKAARASFFMKQGSKANWSDYKNFDSFPEDLKIREYPTTPWQTVNPTTAANAEAA